MRLKFMNALYEATDGDPNEWVGPEKMVEAMGLERFERAAYDNEDLREYEKVVRYLEGERLVNSLASEPGGPIGITHRGIVEVEKALSNPERPTTYFPPATVINYIGSMTNSQAQLSGSESTQAMSVVGERTRQDLAEFVALLRRDADDLGLEETERRELEAEIQTLEAQDSNPNPKAPVLRATVQSIRRIVEGAAVSAASEGVVNGAGNLLSSLPS